MLLISFDAIVISSMYRVRMEGKVSVLQMKMAWLALVCWYPISPSVLLMSSYQTWPPCFVPYAALCAVSAESRGGSSSFSEGKAIGWCGCFLNWDTFSHTNYTSIGWCGRSPNWDAFSHTRPVVMRCSLGVGMKVALGLPDCQQTLIILINSSEMKNYGI
jgi:hypothetical protein